MEAGPVKVLCTVGRFAMVKVAVLLFVVHGIYVWETANSYQGNFGTLADSYCTLSSQAATGTRFYKVPALAFISTPTVSAISRFTSYPVYMGDGTFAASSMTALLSTNLAGRIRNQTGTTTTAQFWTGTTQAGYYSGSSCSGWTSATYSYYATVGSSLGGASWAASGTPACATLSTFIAALFSFLCVQSDYAAPGSIANGIHVFQTSSLYNGSLGGIFGADAKCKAEAARFPALTGRTFRALLATSTATIASRIQPGKPLLGIDGVTLGSSLAVASLPYTIATGTATLPQMKFWLGTSTASCLDWTSAAAGINGADATSLIWLTGAPNRIFCNYSRPLVCIESSSPCVVDPCDFPSYCQERGDYFGRICSCPPWTTGSGLPGQCVSLVFKTCSVTSGATIVGTNNILLASTAAGSVFTVVIALNGTGKNPTAPANTWIFTMKLTNPTLMDVPCTSLTNTTRLLSAANTDVVALTCTLATGGGQYLAALVTGCVIFFGSGTQYCTTLNTTVMFNYPPPTITPGTIRHDLDARGSTSYQSTSAGGTIVFEGTNFQPSLMQVWLGKVGDLMQFPCPLSAWTNITLVYCFPQAGTGTNNFTVIVGSQSATGTDTYIYPVLPSITSVTGCPTSDGQGTANCPTVGGVTLQIFGTSFFGNVTVLVDMKNCINVVSNDSWVSCLLPPGTGVGKAILVTTMNSLSAPQNFISYSFPSISTFTVETDCALGVDNTTLINCDRNGGARLTITGQNFGSTGASVQIGTVPCGNPRNEGTQDSVVTCTLPPGNFINQPVILSVLGGGTVTTGSISYTICSIGTQQDPNNQTNCEPCPNGFENNQIGGFCTACETGKYTNFPGQASCTSCPAGSGQNATGSTNCGQCSFGRYSIVDGQVSCLTCDIGSYTASFGQTSCLLCPQGTYQNTPGMSFCSTCQIGTYSSFGGQQSCLPCELGKYGNGTTPCQLCPSGRFQNMSSQTECWNCPIGRASNSPGQVLCLACDLGYLAPEEGLQICNKCEKGRFQDNAEATSCVECGVGKYTDTEAQFQCKDCGSGTFNIAEGNSVCNQCPVGRYQASTGESFCSICDPGKYAATTTGCRLCPAAEMSVDGVCIPCALGVPASADRTRCECPQGSYMVNDNASCAICAEGLDCSAGGLVQSELTTDAGWWRSSKLIITPMPCISAENCANNDTCAPHRTGVLCSGCVPGYRSSYIGGPCLICASHPRAMANSVGIFILVAIALICIYVLILRQTKYLEIQLLAGVKSNPTNPSAVLEVPKSQSFGSSNDRFSLNPDTSGGSNVNRVPPAGLTKQSTILAEPTDYSFLAKPMDFRAPHYERTPNVISQFKIFIGFLQVLIPIVHHGDLTWPTAFAQMMDALSFINFDFVPWQSLACAVLMDGLTQVVVVCVIPVIALSLAAPVPLVLMLKDKFELSDSHENRVRRGIAIRKFIRIFLFTCFLFYPHVSSVVLGVYNCRNVEGVMYLKTDSTIICGSPPWRSRALPLIIAVVVYPVGIPAMCLYLLYKNRKQLNEPTALLSIGSLYEPYCKDYWFFEVVDMLYKMTMTSLVIFARTTRQFPFGLGLTGVYLVVLLVSDPYKRLADYRLHTFLLADILVMFVFAVTLQQAGPLNTLADTLLSAFLITLVILMVMFFIMVVVITVRGTVYSWIRGRELKRTKETTDEHSFVSPGGHTNDSVLISNLRSPTA